MRFDYAGSTRTPASGDATGSAARGRRLVSPTFSSFERFASHSALFSLPLTSAS